MGKKDVNQKPIGKSKAAVIPNPLQPSRFQLQLSVEREAAVEENQGQPLGGQPLPFPLATLTRRGLSGTCSLG